METIKKLALTILMIGCLQLNAQNNQEVLDAFTKSYSYENEGEYTKAIAQLKNVYDENSYEINLRLGWLNYLSGLFSESMPYYEKCILLKPLSIEARLGIVYPASSMGNWNQVEKRYKEILEIDPENSLVNYRMGLIFYGREDYQTAFNYFEKVVNHYPFDYDSVIMLAWTNYMMGKSREAKVLFQKALLNQPGSESALEGLSLIK
jgi:tetratricopeptide (TPR) repeat protein